NWRVISISHRTDNKTMRVILGNDIAIEAARSNNTNPWPDGAVLGKMVWKDTAEKNWPTAIAPDKFVHAEFMFRDSKKWAGNGTGWGWARWVGTEHKPFAKDAGTGKVCIACHTPVKGNDWVFTTPALFPTVFK
ncbi:Cytochrome p460, partial [hydrothermal vent metagenome]